MHREFFLKNPRLGMLVRSFDKMPEQKQTQLISKVNLFLEKLSN
jgi:deoxyribodipyrimidine photolyase-related protein